MSETQQSIDQDIAAWIGKQPMFFVATAPLATNGHINVSPKGGDSFQVLGPNEVAYQDYTGSGAETAAHLNENGRIVIMFCAFDSLPRILRLHGRGKVIKPGDARFLEMTAHFPTHPATRAFVQVAVTRISTSCGHGVPIMDFRARRGLMEKWAMSKGPDGLEQYRAEKNQCSLDGLPAFGQSS